MVKKQLRKVMAAALVMGMMAMTGCNSVANSAPAVNNETKELEGGTETKGEAAANAEYKLIAAHVSTEAHSFHLGLEEFKKQVEEKSGGRIQVEVHANGELGVTRMSWFRRWQREQWKSLLRPRLLWHRVLRRRTFYHCLICFLMWSIGKL